jgi:hypothetical protein
VVDVVGGVLVGAVVGSVPEVGGTEGEASSTTDSSRTN